MKKYTAIVLIVLFCACEKDRSPVGTAATDKGTITIAIGTKHKAQKISPDSLSIKSKTARPSIVNQLEVRVLKSDNTKIVSEILAPNNGYFEGTIQVKAQDNLKVLCIGTNNGVVEYVGIDDDVDVQAGKTTTAVINGWNDSYIPVISSISPNTSTDGSYAVSWNNVQNATNYVLQEADNQGLSGIGTVYSGSEPMRGFSGMIPGTYFYRVRASNAYGVTSGWSGIATVTVNEPEYTISGTVTGADGVTVTLSGEASDSQVIDDGDTYSFTVAEGESYTITPSKNDYEFTPENKTFTNISSDQTQNYTAKYNVEINMVLIPSGSFLMGDDYEQSNSRPAHMVTIESFEISAMEIMQGQYKYIFGSNSSNWKGDTLPVNYVSWEDAVIFCNRLSDEKGLERCYDEITWICDFNKNGYRLPTEAEWEYACRAGSTTKFYTGDTENDLPRAGWYSDNSSSKTHPVGEKEANLFGLYDMHGNVREWCNDFYSESYYSDSPTKNPTGPETGTLRVSRGGGWGTSAGACGSAYRDRNTQDIKSSYTSFRIASGAFNPGNTISGTVTGADGVKVTLSGDASESQIVADGNTYSFTVEHSGNYTVTPSKLGYSFTPASRDFSSVTFNQTQNFTAASTTIGKIAFCSESGGNFEIHIMDADGSNQRNLTNHPDNDYSPSWSPDGTKIAFSSWRDGEGEIYVMDADGSNPRNFTNHYSDDQFPSWSPDGTKIAFTSDRDGNLEIYVMDADGSNQRNLTNHPYHDWVPSWSPDSTKIAFMSNRDGEYEIYVMDADGSIIMRLTNNSAYDCYPSWSPDGTKIAFESERDGHPEIHVMDADGSNQRNLTNHLYFDRNPSWSPDGTKIAFDSYRDGDSEIYVMDADGSNQRNLTNHPYRDSDPSWSPF